MEVSESFKSDTEEHIDTWKTMVPSNVLTKNISWPRDSKSNLQKQHSFSSQQLSHGESSNFKTRNILAPPKLIIDKNASKQTPTTDQNNIHLSNQHLLDDGKFGESIAKLELEKLLQPIAKSNTVENEPVAKNEKIINKDSLQEKNILTHTIKQSSDEKMAPRLDTTDLKKRLRSLVRIKPMKRINGWSYWSLLFIILLPISIAYLGLFLKNFSSSDFCKPQFKFDSIPQELKSHIYGQEAALGQLNNFFIKNNNQKGFEILSFIGGIGVGKSYAAEIIRNNVKSRDNVLDFFPPLFKKEDQAFSSLSLCGCNIVRLENLKTDDISDAVIFIHNLKKRAKNYCILFLALFNTQEVDFMLQKTLNLDKSIEIIERKFKEADLHSTLVGFSSMSDDALTKCILDAADYANVKLSNDNIEYVKHDLLTADSGCKGAYAKVQLVGKAK